MTDQSYATSFTVDRTPHEAFTAINDVRGWWEENLAGRTHEVNDEFIHWVAGVHFARIRVEELLPGKRVVWRVLDNWMSFIDVQNEWTGTEIRFDIAGTGAGTEVRFTHVGLTPADQCYELCRDAWGMYVTKSLPAFIETGVGRPVLNEDGSDFRSWRASAVAGPRRPQPACRRGRRERRGRAGCPARPPPAPASRRSR